MVSEVSEITSIKSIPDKLIIKLEKTVAETESRV